MHLISLLQDHPDASTRVVTRRSCMWHHSICHSPPAAPSATSETLGGFLFAHAVQQNAFAELVLQYDYDTPRQQDSSLHVSSKEHTGRTASLSAGGSSQEVVST
jgi:hypothetical protein